jgi:signal transduction histidine kinase
LARIVSQGSATLVGEIEAQRDVLRVEDGSLTIPLTPGSVWQVVAETAELYRHSRFCHGRVIEVASHPGSDLVAISRVQLSRVIGNLIKNALEASPPGETVQVRVTTGLEHVTVAVHNEAVMSEAVQAQVFQRFFSTKASSGRGLGTYSVRLLVTRVLGGTVEFTSRAGAGTTFTVRLPRA